MTETAPEELYSLLVPLCEARLIVPRTCIAEVVGCAAPQQVASAPAWLMGTLTWNGRQLPVISFEVAAGQSPPELGARARVVVFHAPSGQLQPPYFGILAQGFPQLVRVNAGVLTTDSEDFPEDGPVICRIRMLNETPLIPDLDHLERMILPVTCARPEP